MGKYQFYISIALASIVLLAINFVYTPSSKEFMGVVNTNAITYSSKSSGRVVRVDIRPGQRVMTGDILVQLEDSDLEREIIETTFKLQKIEAEMNIQKKLTQQFSEGRETNSTVPSEYTTVKKILNLLLDAKKSLKIVASSDGIVGSVLVNEGAFVTKYEGLVTVYSEESSRVTGYIHESGFSDLKKDDHVIIYSSNGEEKMAEGYVDSVAERLVEYPVRLKNRSNEYLWGREVFIQLGAGHKFLNSEKVLIIKAKEKNNNEIATKEKRGKL